MNESDEPLLTASDPRFDALFAIYAESIPARERKSREAIADMAGRRDYLVLPWMRGDVVTGFSIVFLPEADPFCLLEYMAIRTDLRNAGSGRRLFHATADRVRAMRGDIPMLVEVDAVRKGVDDEAAVIRRQAFYRRFGCLRVDGLDYLLPLPGGGPPPPMDLLLHFHGPTRDVRRSELERWLSVVYTAVYGRSPDDPRPARMTGTLTDPVRLVP